MHQYYQQYLANLLIPEEPSWDYTRKYIASSPVFEETKSRYGACRFTMGINELIDSYRTSLIESYKTSMNYPDIDFRILGTYMFKLEVMHAVIVCPKGMLSEFHPLSQTDIIRYINGKWIWQPEATGDKWCKVRFHNITRQVFPFSRRWETIAFAFFFPTQLVQMKIPRDRLFYSLRFLDKDAIKIKNQDDPPTAAEAALALTGRINLLSRNDPINVSPLVEPVEHIISTWSQGN